MNYKKNYLQYFYLLIALLGASLTWLSNFEFMQIYGFNFNIKLFIDLANDNPAAESLSRDLLFTSIAIIVWMYSEVKRLDIKRFWLVLSCTFIVAIAFSLPLFLFLRERRLIELNDKKNNPEVIILN